MTAAIDFRALQEAAAALGYTLVPTEVAPAKHRSKARTGGKRPALPPAEHLQSAWIVRRGEDLALTAKVRHTPDVWVVVDPDGRVHIQGTGAEIKASGWQSAGEQINRSPTTAEWFARLDDATRNTCYLCRELVGRNRVKYCDAHGRKANALHGNLVEQAEGDSYGKNAYSGPIGQARERYERTVLKIA